MGIANVLLGLRNAPGGLGLGGPKSVVTRNKFTKTLQAKDFMDTATPTDVAVITTDFVKLGSGYTVPAQTRVQWGWGSPTEPQNQGYMYAKLIDDTAGDATEEEGLLRLISANARETNVFVVWEGRTEELKGDANDKMKRIALPEQVQFPEVGEDSLLILSFLSDAVDNIQPDFCTIRIPATHYI
jgi:hypothetical protein